MTHRENWLRAIEFRGPEWIPCTVDFGPAMWRKHQKSLEQIMLDHPRLYRGYQAGSACFYEHEDEMPEAYREGETFRDNWGCLWSNVQEGLEGQVIEHPLADWDALESYSPPDLLTQGERGPRDWGQIRREMEAARAAGHLTGGDGERLFDRMYFLRGFENLMMDIATDDPHLPRLIELLTEYELAVVDKWLEIGVDYIPFHTDIATQQSLMISPAKFRQYIKPMFTALFQRCRQAGTHVSLSSDGRVLEIVDDLIECGVSMHDPQLRANGLEGIVQHYKGKLCARVDLDRQSFPFATPGEIRDQITGVVEAMADPRGGLMFWAAVVGTDVPLANIEAICTTLEELCYPEQ